MSASTESYCADLVRRQDYDRYLTTLFAPAAARPALSALYAFNVEIARVREAVSEPLLGRIRLEWWRETVAEIYDGRPRRHPVVQPLAEAVERHGLTRAAFERMIDARSLDLADEPPADMEALVGYAQATSSSLVGLALEVLGAGDDEVREAGRQVGIAWALVGLLRAVPFHARAGRRYLPAVVMEAAGAKDRDLMALRATPALARAVEAVADEARRRLAAARASRTQVPRSALAALLPAVLAGRYLRRLERARYDVITRPVAVAIPVRQLSLAWAAVRGRY